MQKSNEQNKWAEIVAKAWHDEKFKKELLTNPEKVLSEHGIKGIKGVKIVENTNETTYLVLPEKPAKSGLTKDELKKIAAGNQNIQYVPMAQAIQH